MSTNISDIAENRTNYVYIENYDLQVKGVFILIASLAVISSFVAISAMRKTKKIPYASKWLSSGLLIFDVLFIVTSTIRKFVINPVISLHLQHAVTMWLGLCYFTVGLMSMERYILLLKPMKYLNKCSRRKVRQLSILLWISEIGLNLFVRYGVCFWMLGSYSVFQTVGVCNKITASYYAILIFAVFLTSFWCYWKIFQCVKSKVTTGQKMTFTQTAGIIRSYRSTALVFIYLLIITATFIAYGIVIVLIQSGSLQKTPLRLAIEIMYLSNCFINPFLYVFWFKECRMYVLQTVSFVVTKYRPMVDRMKMEIYNIPESKEAFNTNEVSMVQYPENDRLNVMLT
jgi:hypothetical protein